jgi:transposase-like protein
MYFGSDDEKAITKSIQDAFPSATRRLCSKHLKDNFNNYMQDKIGIDTKERQKNE